MRNGTDYTAMGIIFGLLLLAFGASYAINRTESKSQNDWDKLPSDVMRVKLENEFRKFVSERQSSLNFIRCSVTPSSNGFELYAYHSMFGKYDFQIGRFGKDVSAWIVEHQNHLTHAGITKVGVRGDSSSSWFDVKSPDTPQSDER